MNHKGRWYRYGPQGELLTELHWNNTDPNDWQQGYWALFRHYVHDYDNGQILGFWESPDHGRDAPACPQVTQSEARDDYIRLTWTTSPTASAYRVYRNGVPHGYIASDEPYVNDFDVATGGLYEYEIRALSRDGTESTR